MNNALNLAAPFALIASILYLSKAASSDNKVSADFQYPKLASSGGDTMNSSLTGSLGASKIDSKLIGARLKPIDLNSTVSNYDDLIGKNVLSTSHGNVKMDARLGYEVGLSRAPVASVHAGVNPQSSVLPSVVDPSSAFMSSSISIMRNPTYDIRGEPPISVSDVMDAPIPTFGPWQPDLKEVSVASYHPIKVNNASSQDFFT
jgi:hypothetical protein